MGVVYAVEHTGLPLHYAIKVLRRRFAQRNDLAGRLRAEAQCLAHLASHPNVVRVIDTGSIDDGRVYLLMELLEGRTLREELFYHKSFSPLEAATIGRQLVSALGAAHRLGVIHRDVKPSNVFLTGGGVVKLLDFGVAKVLHEGLLGAARKPLTEPGSLMGTPRYMAPEYLLGGKATDGRVDLYSAGVVLWEMLTGRSAFPLRDDNDQERMKVVHAIVTQGVPPLEAVGFGHLPAALRAVVRRATVADPEQRYATAEAFIGELDEAARANPPSGRTKVIPPSGRTQVMSPAAALGPFTSGQAQRGEETIADEDNTEPDMPYTGAPSGGFSPNAAQTTAHVPAYVPGAPPGYAPGQPAGYPGQPPPGYAGQPPPGHPSQPRPGQPPPGQPPPGQPPLGYSAVAQAHYAGQPPPVPPSLLPSSTTPPGPLRRSVLSYQVVLGSVVFSAGFLCSAAFVWNLTHRPPSTDGSPPHASAITSQGLEPEPVPPAHAEAARAAPEPTAAPPPDAGSAAATPPAAAAEPSKPPPAEAAEPSKPPAEAAEPSKPPPSEMNAAPAPAETVAAPSPARVAEPKPAPAAPPAAPSEPNRGREKAAGKSGTPGANPSPLSPPKRKFRPGF